METYNHSAKKKKKKLIKMNHFDENTPKMHYVTPAI